jgi:uncharacterized repeat protein (TIGR01451 family)
MKAFSTLILSMFCWLQLAAQCTTYAGSPQSLMFHLCAGQSFDVSTLGDEVFDNNQPSDTLTFVVHNGGPTTLGNTILGVNSAAGIPPATGHFEWSAAYQPGVTYYITAFAGNTASSPVAVDLNDPCLSVSFVGTIIYDVAPPVNCTYSTLMLSCSQPSVEITEPYLCTGSSPDYLWSWSGTNSAYTSTDPTPTILVADTYCATVTNPVSGCSATACVTVEGTGETPLVIANSLDLVIDCITTSVTPIPEVIPSTGSEIYSWTTTNGIIVGSPNQPNPVFTSPGEYCLTVTYSFSGCSATDCMVVTQDAAVPVADAGPDRVTYCPTYPITVTGNVTLNPEHTYIWTTIDGSILSSPDAISPTFNNTGTYCLTVQDLTNGCAASDCMNIILTDIIVDAGPDQFENCDGEPVLLGGPNTTIDSTLTMIWILKQGNQGTQVGLDSAFIGVVEPGEYCLNVGIPYPNCVLYEDCVIVHPGTTPPNVQPGALSCEDGTTLIGTTNFIEPVDSNLVFEWTTPNGNILAGQDSTIALVDEAGTYCLTVTDTATGCSATVCDTVYEEIHLNLEVLDTVCPSNSALRLTTVRPLPEMFFYNIFIEIEGFPVFVETGYNQAVYHFPYQFSEPKNIKIWVESQSGSCVSDTLEQTIAPTLPHTFTVEENGCDPVIVSVELNVPDPSGYDFEWTNAQGAVLSNLVNIPVTEQGWYYLSITNEQGTCTWTDSLFVTVPFQGNCATISGNALRNLNGDCLPNANDTPLSGWLVQAVGVDTFYATTDVNGNYLMPVDPGNYTVSIVPTTVFWVPCGNDFPVNLPNPDDVATVDFLVKKLPGCPEMAVDITTPFLRRCFPSNYFVNYCNQGVEPATDAYVTVQLDDFLTFNIASIPHTDLGNNLYRFDLGDVDTDECGFFNINVTVSCNAVLGQTHCTEANIYPDTTCVPNDPLWSGASLRAAAECQGDSLRFIITNEGTAPSAPLDYIVIEDAVMYMEDPPSPSLQPAEAFVLAVPANGATWRLEVRQEPYHPAAALPIVAVEGCGGSNFSTGFVNQFPLGDDPPFLDIDCTPNIGAYDPNDKQGFPIGYGEAHQILPGTELQYLIRFQNTGTDTAFTVVIRDTLSSLLDITTIRPGAASHPYEYEIYAEGVLKFTFPDILLPDSSTNQAASNGFVHFTARPRGDVPLGSVIENTAAIYFDFNEPVLTNTVFHTVDSNFLEVNWVSNDFENLKLELTPNPFTTGFRLFLQGYPTGYPLTFTLFDAMGRRVDQHQFLSPRLDFESKGLVEGLYFFKIEDDKNLIASGKAICQFR